MNNTPVTSFSDLDLSTNLIQALESVGYEQPSPIQAQSIPPLLDGRDLLGIAQTGTGKTAAFALPLLSNVDLSLKSPQVLVLTPTRELAIQVAEAFMRYAQFMKGFHVLPLYGGQDMRTQLRQLSRGVHVIVATPGRAMDHLRRGTLKLDQLRTVVLDEADEMLRMGFIEDVEWILEQTPDDRQVALFSATMPEKIERIANRYLSDPAEVRIQAQQTTVERIEQRYVVVPANRKMEALTRILEVEEFDAMIIFVRTRNAAVEVAEKLEARGFASAAINGDMNQTLRERTINNLKQGKLDVLVATDVAARGLDVSRITHVFNYDVPYDTEAYVHRIGRTGRAGRSGTAILLVTHRERRMLRAIESATRQKLKTMDIPSLTQLAKKRSEQFKAQVQETITDQGEQLDFFRNLLLEICEESSHPIEDVAAALAYRSQLENPLQVALNEDDEFEKPRPSRGRSSDMSGMQSQRYRLAVGRSHNVKPGDIVGAMANEAGIEPRHIGDIRIFDAYTVIELPTGMPKELLAELQKVRIRNTRINMREWDERPGGGGGGNHRPKPKRRHQERGDHGSSPRRGRKKSNSNNGNR